MFELLNQREKKLAMPRAFSVSGAVIGAFGLGVATGKLLMGAKPTIDWTLTGIQLASMLFWTILCSVMAVRRDSSAGN